jgi:hypothetical protein|tara:strand:+ start:1314 stop:1532 length:219 start_codon:yes stop_codon:yes gene_type:complete
MEIVKTELTRHSALINKIWDVVYSNPIHILGKPQYKDKRKLWELRNRVTVTRQLLRRRDLQFLERVFIKYSL